MHSSKKIQLDLKIIPSNEETEIDGIIFSGVVYIQATVSGIVLLEQELFSGSFIFLKELGLSTMKSGEYLIFTSVSGIADDAGWDRVTVKHDGSHINWVIQRDGNILQYLFDKEEYIREVRNIEQQISEVDNNLKLEPIHVIYPE